MTYTAEDARRYTAGVDRSPTEVAALFLADEPDGDPVAFLVEALGLDEEAAWDAVGMLKPQEPAQQPAGEPESDDDAQDDADDGDGDEEPAEGAPSKTELLERAAELGIEVSPRWGAERLAAAIAAAEAGA